MTDAIAEQPLDIIRDVDRDALFILPLSIVPLKTPALRRARLIKNVRLESVVELFDDADTGSGQIDIEALPNEFCWPDIPIHPDLEVLRKLALLPSFDVYALRILLREQGIPINNHDALKLSKRKSEELTEYMTAFTRPLIMKIYGDDDVSIKGFEDIVALFREPDMKRALEKLKIMAHRLEIKIQDIPKFLEDYGDIFLSLAYYRQCLDNIEPIVGVFMEWTEDLCRNRQVQNDAKLMETCRTIQAMLNGLMFSLNSRFDNFDSSTKDMWKNVSASRFRKVERTIKGYHTTIGGVLCSLTVKLETWAKLFPHKKSGGPSKRSEFIMSEMRLGIDKIQKIEDSAPRLANIA
jgi:hypothetical protein